MKDKVSQACDYILDKIESGEYKVGEAIPAARKLTQEVGASFAIVQHAVTVLSNAGILRSINRQGSVVRDGWQECLLPNHFVVFNNSTALRWLPGFQKLLAEKLPETTDEKRYILRLAEVTCDKDQKTYSVAQIRAVGDIEVLGRWVK